MPCGPRKKHMSSDRNDDDSNGDDIDNGDTDDD